MKPEKAIKIFEETLAGMGRSITIFWLFKDNCLITPETLYFTWDSSLSQEPNILSAHEEANLKNIGVQYTCLCEFNGISLCYQWVPGNQNEMDNCMVSIDGKYSVQTRPFNVDYSTSKFRYQLKTFFRKQSQLMDEIPSKKILI